MKNYLKYILCLFLPMLLVGCIYDKFDQEGEDLGGEEYDSVSYLSFSINVPDGGDGTRADEKDNNASLNHGNVDEYTIYNAYLLLFEQPKFDSYGNSVNPWFFNATFCDCFAIIDKETLTDQIPHISRRYIIRNFELWKFIPYKDRYYFGVILANIDPNAIKVDCDKKEIQYRIPPSGYETITANGSYTYSRMKDEMMLPMDNINTHCNNMLSVTSGEKKYLTMSNAMLFPIESVSPIQKGIIEAVNITDHIKPEKVSIDPNYIDPTWPQFYLERLAAKVEVTSSITDNKGTLNIGGTTYNYELKSWCLANVSPQNYVMRHGDMEWDILRSASPSNVSINRFTSYSHIESEGTPNPSVKLDSIYRGYFSESTEYLKCTRSIWGSSEPKYDGNEGRPANVSSIPADKHYGGNFFSQEWHSFGDIDYCHENTMKVWRMMVKYATHVVVEAEFWTGSTKPTTLPSITVNEKNYINGKAYYILPISHFGDEYTPWNVDEWGTDENNRPKAIELPYSGTAAEILAQEQSNIVRSYPRCRTHLSNETITPDQEGHMSPADGNYLGRWGVVRNTWYAINIKSVEGIGLNEDPTVNYGIITNDPTPLDYYENLLKCTIKVKDWKVRDQSVTLQ